MAESEFERALDQLRSKKVRLTPQRKTILQYLISHHTHPSAEMIYADLKDSVDNISMATVYNTVKMLVDYGLVIELKNGDGSSHYDYFGHPHFHVVCDNCGKIADVFDPQFSAISRKLEEVAHAKSDYLVTGTSIEVTGLCPDCQRKLHLHS